MKIRGIVCWSLLLSVATCFSLQSTDQQSGGGKNCERFVQAFYDWYVSNRALHTNLFNRALTERSSDFSAALTREIEASKAQADLDQEPFLDFDPVLNTQDPAPHYLVRVVRESANACSANVYTVQRAQKKPQQPVVIAELGRESGKWVFTNFHYPQGTDASNRDLLSLLKYHRADQEPNPMPRTHQPTQGPVAKPTPP